MRRWASWLAAVAVLAWMAGDARGDGLVVESHALGSAMASEHEASVTALHEAFEQRGFAAAEQSTAIVLALRPSQPAHKLPQRAVARARAQIEKGYEAWINGAFKTCIARTTAGLEVLLAAPATLANDPAAVADVQRAYILLGLAHNRRKAKKRSDAALAALIRSFPDYAIDMARWGPEPIELHKRARVALEQGGKGTLDVQAPGFEIAIDGRFVGKDSIREQLFAGPHRVYVRGLRQGWFREIEVPAGRTVSALIDPVAERSVQIDGERIAMRFANHAERSAQQDRVAAALARLAGERRALVIGIDNDQGRARLVATLVDARRGQRMRAAALALGSTPVPAARIAALADSMSTGTLAGDVIALAGFAARQDRATSLSPNDEAESSRFGAWKWASMASGGTLLALGIVGIVLDGSDAENDAGVQNERQWTTLPHGIASTILGVALIGTSVYMILDDTPNKPERLVDIRLYDGGVGFSVSGTF